MNAFARTAVLVGAAMLIAGCGSNASPPAANTSSASYQMGLQSGTKGLAETEAFKGTRNDEACEAAFDIEQGASRNLNKQDFMAGCLYGLSHQSAQWTKTRRK